MNYPAAELRSIKMNFNLINPDAEHRGILLIKKLRSASERANSSLKEDIKILHKPRVLNATRANILAQMAAIVLLLKRAFSFVVNVTCQLRKILNTNGSIQKQSLSPYIPKSILRLLKIQLE